MKTAIVYSHKALKTAQVAKAIKEFWKKDIDDLDIDDLSAKKLADYKMLILGVPTWFDGELPYYWDEMVPAIEELSLTGVKVAIFGNGDQVGYPENFGDAVGLMAQIFESTGAQIVGLTKTESYTFDKSLALRGDKFLGLVLDFENQQNQNKKRVENWTTNLVNI